MIIKTILMIFGGVIGQVIRVATTNAPGQELHVEMMAIVQAMLSITQQGINFLYFIIGDTINIVLPVAITLLGLKYTIVPLVQIFRSFFINSNV